MIAHCGIKIKLVLKTQVNGQKESILKKHERNPTMKSDNLTMVTILI